MPVVRAALAVPAVRLAPRLLGAVLSSRIGGEQVAIRLTEVEAYAGAEDPASHAFRGKTARAAAMFGPAGHLYTYFSYGRHWCANVVCGPDGQAAAVLLRAGEVIDGEAAARRRRPTAAAARDLARGPARLAACLGLDAASNGIDLCDPASPVMLDGVAGRRPPGVLTGPRVGIAAATEFSWRFWLDGEPSVSAFRAGRRPPAARDRQT